jgi:predicted ABC-type ATPase
VKSRVERGGHEIPEGRIRERYTRSRLNLIQLLPNLTELLLYYNSEEGDPKTGEIPKPRLILHLVKDRVPEICDLTHVPEWAKSVVATAIKMVDSS